MLNQLINCVLVNIMCQNVCVCVLEYMYLCICVCVFAYSIQKSTFLNILGKHLQLIELHQQYIVQ